MLSKVQKGDFLEYICQKHYESEGYECFKSQRKGIWTGRRYISMDIDIFDCDILGIHPSEKMLFVQVTTGASHASERRIKLSKKPWNLAHHDVLVWSKRDGYILIEQYDGEKWQKQGKIIIDVPGMCDYVRGYRALKSTSYVALCAFMGLDKKKLMGWQHLGQ